MQVNIQGVLRKNRTLANLHAGQRCFILGSGPSIKNQNLTALKGDIKIALSWFHNHSDCILLDPQYWLIADPDAWIDHTRFLDPLLNFLLGSPIRPKVFMPIGALEYFASVAGAGFLDLHFFQFHRSRTLSEGLDFSQPIPEMGQNVVIPALLLALYLGCNPIYLLGCDHDWWTWTRESYQNECLPHFFEKRNLSLVVEKHSYDDLQRTIRVQRHQYRQVKQYAEERGFAINNATKGGYLDIFPRVDFESLLGGEDGVLKNASGAPADPAAALASAAIRLFNSGETVPALELVDRAIAENQNHDQRVEGLDYLKAVGLARLGMYRAALVSARMSLLREPSLRSACEAVVRDLESRLNIGSCDPRAHGQKGAA